MMIHGLGFLGLSASLVLPLALTGLVEGQKITESLVRDILPSSSVQKMPLPSRKLISQASGTIYYVSDKGNDRNSGTSAKSPFKTIQRAANLTNPGDTVRILAGTYKNDYPTGSVVDIKRSGKPGKWIKYEAYPSTVRPKLKFNGWNGILLKKDISYIEIKGLEIEGNNQNVTLAYAKSQSRNSSNPLTNGNCISLDGRQPLRNGNRPHHIKILNNKIHDCGGGGVAIIESDYVTVDNNEVFNNGWDSVHGNSGISVLSSWNSGKPKEKDDNKDYRILITRNKVYNNKMLIPWFQTGKIQDGNGIIVDRSRNDDKGSILKEAYKGRTLIANNISYLNGGSGIHTFKSDHVDIIHNTVYLNNQTPEITYGQIMTNSSSDVKVLNNILCSENNKPINSNFNGSNITFNYNLYANKNNNLKPNSNLIRVYGSNDATGNPRFKNAPAGNFELNSGSPAINKGTRFNGVTTDIDKNNRGSAPDKGAYEI